MHPTPAQRLSPPNPPQLPPTPSQRSTRLAEVMSTVTAPHAIRGPEAAAAAVAR